MPRAPAAAAAAARSSGASAGRFTAIGRSVAMSWNERSSRRVGEQRAARAGRHVAHRVGGARARPRACRAGAAGRRRPSRRCPWRREAVRRVAAQRDEVGHLRRIDAVALAHLGRLDELRPVLAAAGNSTRTCSSTHWNMSRSPVKSSVAAAGGGLGAARAPRAGRRPRARRRPPTSSRTRRRTRGASAHWWRELVGHRRAVGVVGGEAPLAVRRRLGAEAQDDGARGVALDGPQHAGSRSPAAR